MHMQPEKKKIGTYYNAHPEKKYSYRANSDAQKAKVRGHYHSNLE